MSARSLLIVESDRLSATDPQLYAAIGDMADMFRRSLDGIDAPVMVVNPAAGEVLPPPETLAGVIIGGAAAMAADPDLWIDTLGRWVEEVVRSGLPVLGVCFGHQLLAHRLGGQVGANEGGPEYGTVEVALLPGAEDDELLAGLPPRFGAQAAHFQTVSTLPVGATALASGVSGVQAARFARRCWGVQFHPEFSREAMRDTASIVAQRVAPGVADQLLPGFACITDTPDAATIIRRFARLAFFGHDAQIFSEEGRLS